ncbi:hypothetical protein CONPUDRAFT_72220 [Coniophora puteana RWD-64-598 SS2]|uniref:Uncharacterized protein n=1 Tax=Coniophora puteana (strain RWD-64-598) TaxID=741705 RepID=A0A5M3MRQ5_CONPW|nr:uncharacterized protein CONPUDRAFT_72220 [Coniophora puteana RWD-64-598 SS2]EIW81838.1 hypothetical protein CONPUDRAFT_72220 [Coniophora puteana RWD-64-598 SS2]
MSAEPMTPDAIQAFLASEDNLSFADAVVNYGQSYFDNPDHGPRVPSLSAMDKFECQRVADEVRDANSRIVRLSWTASQYMEAMAHAGGRRDGLGPDQDQIESRMRPTVTTNCGDNVWDVPDALERHAQGHPIRAIRACKLVDADGQTLAYHLPRAISLLRHDQYRKDTLPLLHNEMIKPMQASDNNWRKGRPHFWDPVDGRVQVLPPGCMDISVGWYGRGQGVSSFAVHACPNPYSACSPVHKVTIWAPLHTQVSTSERVRTFSPLSESQRCFLH